MRPASRDRLSVVVLLFALALSAATDLPAQPSDIRAVLDRAREVSYHEHWVEAQAMLDEIASEMDPTKLTEWADFELLQARHLILADRKEEALARVEALLDLDPPPDRRIRALQLRANVAVLLRRYEPAFESLSEALSIDVDLDDPAPLVGTLNMAAYMLGRVGEHDRGLEYGERALSIARNAGQTRDACVALQRLAPVYKWANQTERAEAVYREGIRDCQTVGNTLFVGVLQHGLADLLRRKEQLDVALGLVEQSIEALGNAVYTLGEYEARVVRAEVKQDLGLLDEAWLDELELLNSYFSEHSLWDQSARLELLRSEVAEDSGDFAGALASHRRYVQARESFLDRERAMRLAYLQVEFDSRFQQQQIDLLRETARVAQLEARSAAQEQRLRTFAWVAAGLVILILGGLLHKVIQSRRLFRELSRHDGLSGLANHSWFFERAQAMIDDHAAASGKGQLVLVAADIDHFKKVNDRFGHRVGDSVLGRTGQRLREVFPEEALVGRIGGEEFAVLLSVGAIDEALQFIERFRQPDQRVVRSDDPAVTVSFGISCARAGDTIDTLRDRADMALYRAKEAGRDRYEIDESCSSEADE